MPVGVSKPPNVIGGGSSHDVIDGQGAQLVSNTDAKSIPRSSFDVTEENGTLEPSVVDEEKSHAHDHMSADPKDSSSKPPRANGHNTQLVTLDSEADDVEASGRDRSDEMSCDDKARLLSSEEGGIESQGT